MIGSGEESLSVRAEYALGQQQSRIVSAIATWCEALHGTATLNNAFADLCIGLGAGAGMLVRSRRADGHQQRIALHDPGADRNFGRPLRLCLSETVFGPALDGARAGTIWHEADAPESPDPFLKEFQSARGFSEFCVLVLSAGPVERDHIELHFHEPRSDRIHATLATVLPTMARTWAAREMGVVARELGRRRADSAGGLTTRGEAILGPGNPARLSRSEYRICLLLSRGLSARGVASELGVGDPTVRTHLRNIYAKTQTASQAELLFRLIGPQATTTFGQVRYA